jgi:uncharacterized protein YecE (DUF72 family)
LGSTGQLNPRFKFTAKLYEALTHQRNAKPQDDVEFKTGINPLTNAGKLGALLLQFPWSFRFDAENRSAAGPGRGRWARARWHPVASGVDCTSEV